MGTKTRIDAIDVTSFLYSSWPIYQLMDCRPTWFSTYYDVNKKWHNRFYQVFLDEQKEQKGMLTFVRNWYWCSQTTAYEGDFCHFILDEEDDFREKAVELWSDRYNSLGFSPIVEFGDSSYAHFEQTMEATTLNGRLVAVSKVIRSPMNYNPFSVFNAIHINIFEIEISKNPDLVLGIVRTILANQFHLKIKATAITLDYNVEVNADEIPNLHYFCPAKCLSATSAHIPSLISNNALCFEEIKARSKA